MRFKRAIPIILTAGMIFSGITPAHSEVSSVYAQSNKSITAENLTFTSTETGKKQIVFTHEGIDDKNLGFEYETIGVISVNSLGEVTPLDIGKVKVKIFDTTDESVYATITVSVWQDRLPAPPTVSLSASTTENSLTITNNSTGAAEGSYFEYSLNGVIWQKDTKFSGLKENTEYKVYARCKTSDGYVYYESDNALITIKTDDKGEEIELSEREMSVITLREGNTYELNLTNFSDIDITAWDSEDSSIATINITGSGSSRKALVKAVKEGEAKVSFIADYSTETKIKYVKYNYKVKVTPVPKVTITGASCKYETVTVTYDKSSIPDGNTVKLSFDKMNWVAGDSIDRSIVSGTQQDIIYAAYFDKDGYMRSVVTEYDIHLLTNIVAYDECPKCGDIKLKVGETYDFYKDNVNTKREVTYYNYETSNKDIAYFTEEGLIYAKKAGSVYVYVKVKSSYFDENGNTRKYDYIYSYPIYITDDEKTNTEKISSTTKETKTTDDKTSDSKKEASKDSSNDDVIYIQEKVTLTVPKVKLSKSSYTYNGKEQKPKVTVKVGRKTIKAKDYKLTFGKGRTKVGRYKVSVSLKDSSGYRGSFSTYYYILPKKVAIKSVKYKKSGTTIKWKKGSKGITGYEIQYTKDHAFKKNVKSVKVKGISKLSKKIKIKKGCFVRVRAYKYDKNGKKYIYGTWSNAKKVK